MLVDLVTLFANAPFENYEASLSMVSRPQIALHF